MKAISPYFTTVLLVGALSVSGCVAMIGKPPRRDVVVVEPERRGPPPWAPAHGWRRKQETYYYYPAIQVYYYPAAQRYYWLEGGAWKIGARLPSRYVIRQQKSVVVELDDEPHKRHQQVKTQYPPNYFEKRGKGKGRKHSF